MNDNSNKIKRVSTPREQVIATILKNRAFAAQASAAAFAPANIALCKYWGKRDESLNLPLTASLSVSLGELGTQTRISLTESETRVSLNGQRVDKSAEFFRRIEQFLAQFPWPAPYHFAIETRNNIPTAAGLASSASGFAALVLALNDLFGWQLSGRELSILARLGSGSASRSIYTGFVEWHAGTDPAGLDSFAEPLEQVWPDLRVGVLTLKTEEKAISSRVGMKRTRETSVLYQVWPDKVRVDLQNLKHAIQHRDFALLGQSAESNALAMHATMISAWPPVVYWLPESLAVMQRIWQLRNQGLPLYFTMDAGPNIKLLFLQTHTDSVQAAFPGVQVVAPFSAR